MGVEYRLAFADTAWYVVNRGRLAERVRALPRLTEEVPPDEYRLKDGGIDNLWTYDLRLFLAPTGVDVEVSAPSASFREDLRNLIDWIRLQTPVELLDDDGLPFEGW